MPNAFEDFLTAPAPDENAFAEFLPKRNAFADFTETAAEPPADPGPGWTSDKLRRVGEGAGKGFVSIPEAALNTGAGLADSATDVARAALTAGDRAGRWDRRHSVADTMRAQAGAAGTPELNRLMKRQQLEAQQGRDPRLDNPMSETLREGSAVLSARKELLREDFNPNPKYDRTLGAQIASGVGSTIPGIMVAIGSGGTAVPAYATTGLQLYQETFDEGTAKGYTPQQAHAAGLKAMPLAGFEKIGDIRMAKALRKGLADAFTATVKKVSTGRAAGRAAGQIGQGMVGEALTEGAQDLGQQKILYDNVDWGRTGNAALVGGLTGGLVSSPGAALSFAGNVRAKGEVFTPPAAGPDAPKVFSEFGGEERQNSPAPNSENLAEGNSVQTTVRESLAAQLDRFRTGQRPAVLFTPNDADPILAEGEVLTPTEHGRILHRPDTLPVQAVTTAARENRMGDVLGYGVSAKPASAEGAFVLTQRNAQGTPVNDVGATPETAPNITSALQQQSRPGDTLEQRAPEAVIAERAAAFGQALDQRDQQQHDWSEFAKPSEGAKAETVAERAAAVRENLRVMEELRAAKAKAAPTPEAPSPVQSSRFRVQSSKLPPAEAPAEAVATTGRALGERPWDIIDDLEANVGKLSLGSALKQAEDFKPAGLLKKLFAKTGGYGLDDALNNLHQMGLARRIETEGELLDALHNAAGARENWQEEAARMEAGLIAGTQAEKWADTTLRESARRSYTGLDPAVLAAYVVKGAAIIERGVRDFGAWSAEMVREFGEAIRPHLDAVKLEADRRHISYRPPVEIAPPAEWAGLEQDALREAAETSLRALEGQSVEHPELGRIRFGGAGRKKILSASADAKKLLVVPQLPELLASAAYVGRYAPNAQDGPNISGYHRLRTRVRLNGQNHDLGLLVREDDKGKLHYNHRVFDEKESGPTVTSGSGPERLTDPAISRPDSGEGATPPPPSQAAPNIPSDPPEGHGLRAFVGKTERARTLSPEVLAGLTDRFYKIESDEERAQVAQAVIDRYGADEALALYQDTDARVMPASFRSTLGAALVDHAAKQERTARALGDTAGSTRWVDFQRTILAQHSQESTATGQALESMKAWYRLTPAAKLAEARATFEQAARRVWTKAKPDVDAFMGRLQEARRVAWQQLFADPAVNRAARAAVDEAIATSPETHRGIVMEVTDEWAQSPYIVAEARRQMRELVNSQMRRAGQTTGGLKELKARFGLMMDDVVNRAVTIANGHYQGSDALPSGAPMRTLSQKFQERLGLNKAASEKMAVAFDKEFARLVDVKRKGIQKRLATQRARQAEGLAGGETNPVDRALRAQLRAHNLKLGQIAKMHADAKAEAGRSIIESIVQSSGLTGEKADALRATLERRFAELLKAAAAKEIAKLTPRQKKTLEKKGAGNALLEAARLGALDTQQAYELVQERLGLPTFTAEIQARLIRMFNDIEAVPKDQLARRHRMESDALEFIAQQKGIEFWNDIVPGLFFNNALSGPITHLRNFGFTGLLGIMDNMVTLVHHAARGDFTAADTMLRAARDGAGRGLLSASEEIITGKVHKTGEKVQQSTAFNAFKFKGPLARPLNALLWLQRAPGRFLRAEDLFWFKSNEEIAQSLALRRVARSEGLRGEALKQRVANDRGRVDERVAAAEAQAVREGYGSETVKRKLEFRQRVWEIITAQREQLAPGSGESAVQYALRNTLTNDPYGALGYVLQHFDGAIAGLRRNDSRVANALGTVMDITQPFRRIAVNALNETLNWTPVGNVRAWREGSITGALKPEGMDAEALGHLHTKAIVGSALLGTLGTLAIQGLISLFALGPDDREKRKLWQQAGGVPYSIKVGNTSLKYQSSPLGYPLAILGAYHDAIRYRNLDEQDADVRAAFVMNAAMRSWLDQSFLNSTKDLLDGLSSASMASAPEHLVRSLARPVATTAVPGKAFFDFVDRVFDPMKYDAHDMRALLAQQVPFVRRNGRPELDALGQPVRVLVTDKDFRSVDPDPLYVAFDRANVWPSTPSRETIAGDRSRGPDYYRVLTPEEYYDYVRESGGDIRDRLDPDRILSLEPAQAQAYVQKVVREARERALRRVPR